MKFQPPKQQPLLVTLTSADDLKSEKAVLDPNGSQAGVQHEDNRQRNESLRPGTRPDQDVHQS